MQPRLLLPLLMLLSLTSCATLFNRKEYKLKIYAYENNVKAKVNDSIYTLPAYVKVKRSKEDLAVQFITDTLTHDIIVKSSVNPEFIYGNLAFLQLAPAGYVSDCFTDKRFYYGRKLLFKSWDTTTVFTPPIFNGVKKYFAQKYPVQKGQVNFTISIPYVNGFYMRPQGEGLKMNTGFFGLSAGLEYYYKDNTFAKINIASAIDFDFFIPVPVEGDGPYQSTRNFSISFTNNHKLSRFVLGYGLSYAKNKWEYNSDNAGYPDFFRTSSIPHSRKKTSHSFGLAFNAYHQFTDEFFMGVVYNPTFYDVSPAGQFNYQHIISFDLMWKVRLWK